MLCGRTDGANGKAVQRSAEGSTAAACGRGSQTFGRREASKTGSSKWIEAKPRGDKCVTRTGNRMPSYAYSRINYNAPLPIIRQTLYRFDIFARWCSLAWAEELPSRVGAESRGRCWRAPGVCADPCAVPQAASRPTGRPLNPRAISSRMTTGGRYCPASAATRLLGSARRALLQRLRPHADLRLEQLGLGLHLGVSKAHGAGPHARIGTPPPRGGTELASALAARARGLANGCAARRHPLERRHFLGRGGTRQSSLRPLACVRCSTACTVAPAFSSTSGRLTAPGSRSDHASSNAATRSPVPVKSWGIHTQRVREGPRGLHIHPLHVHVLACRDPHPLPHPHLLP